MHNLNEIFIYSLRGSRQVGVGSNPTSNTM